MPEGVRTMAESVAPVDLARWRIELHCAGPWAMAESVAPVELRRIAAWGMAQKSQLDLDQVAALEVAAVMAAFLMGRKIQTIPNLRPAAIQTLAMAAAALRAVAAA